MVDNCNGRVYFARSVVAADPDKTGKATVFGSRTDSIRTQKSKPMNFYRPSRLKSARSILSFTPLCGWDEARFEWAFFCCVATSLNCIGRISSMGRI